MGRKIPLGEVHPTHPLIYFLFLTASIAAIISIVSSLCGILERIKGSPDHSVGDIKENVDVVSTSPNKPENATILDAKHEDSIYKKSEENILQQPLPPPPAIRVDSSNNLRTNLMASTRISRSNSSMKSLQRKLSASLSMKAISEALTHRHEKINSKIKHEDSIWKKQIILGERCKVPNQDEDDTILYDENGIRISTYHPKQLSVMSISRQSSEIDANAIPK
ncbi:hypothetical protein FXO38_13747 [Capsicum annuum]|uniref:Uncharacterized protein n=1 Tax=Capsicum annuum TaxID=4072 RepID=A0A1U8H7V4_CAPAN|nr:hypothetical protein FXO38_13747 [Capsicum annuum]KAF3659748.1 hypothetical protein FXO37_13844 [Capsicum annuum]PHT78239.1 hypothetical protein T459_16291 [Capsicum annuum]